MVVDMDASFLAEEHNAEGSILETNTTQTTPGQDGIQLVPLDTAIGLILAFSSCFFIGTSVIYKKLALRDLEAHGETRAVDGGFGYLRSKKWWFGITLMGLGELTNFVAYIFAPAILVTPLGVFSIVCTATLSPYFLNERLTIIGKLGCLLVLVGCIMVTLSGPKDREIGTMEELQSQLLNPGFLIYASLVVGVSIILMALVPRYGHKYVMLYITICSSFGSLSVMFCKGVGLALKQTVTGTNEFTKWPTWVCIVALVGCLLIETVYMQRALDIFNSSVFMSINYVMFTSLVIIASSILYTELKVLGWKNIILTILGFIVNITALYLLHLAREKVTSLPAEETSAIHSPDRDPETPLMTKTNNNDEPQGRVKEMGQSHPSPLANINLSPSLLRDGMKSKVVLAFRNRENISDHCQEKSAYSVSSHGNSSEHNECSLSNKSSVSQRSSLVSVDGVYKSDFPCVVGPQCQCLREVPLITKLHSSSSRINGQTSPTSEVNSADSGKNSEDKRENCRPLSQISNDGLSDINEGTRLVEA